MKNQLLREILIVLLASIILGFTVSFPNTATVISSIIYFLILITINILAKKLISYYFEANSKIKFWSWEQFWFTKKAHFKKPIPMLWLPLILTIFTKGYFYWLGILGFDVEPKTERISRRHGLYRFTQMTDWHIGLIAASGVIANLLLGIIAYLIGFEPLARLSIYYAAWSVIPISDLDGTKILFSNRVLWFTITTITAIFLLFALSIV